LAASAVTETFPAIFACISRRCNQAQGPVVPPASPWPAPCRRSIFGRTSRPNCPNAKRLGNPVQRRWRSPAGPAGERLAQHRRTPPSRSVGEPSNRCIHGLRHVLAIRREPRPCRPVPARNIRAQDVRHVAPPMIQETGLRQPRVNAPPAAARNSRCPAPRQAVAPTTAKTNVRAQVPFHPQLCRRGKVWNFSLSMPPWIT